MNGPWSAPAMYKLDVGSLGVQLGTSSTDYVILVQTKTGAQKILSGKLKMGADATAVAGPTGAKAVGANDLTSISSPTPGQRAACSPARHWLAHLLTPTMTPTRTSMAKTSRRHRSYAKAQ